MPLDLSDVDVKEGLVAGAKTILPRGAMGDLMVLEAHRLFMHPRQWRVPPGGPKYEKWENERGEQQPMLTQPPSLMHAQHG